MIDCALISQHGQSPVRSQEVPCWFQVHSMETWWIVFFVRAVALAVVQCSARLALFFGRLSPQSLLGAMPVMRECTSDGWRGVSATPLGSDLIFVLFALFPMTPILIAQHRDLACF
jgi:hypothetical protein